MFEEIKDKYGDIVEYTFSPDNITLITVDHMVQLGDYGTQIDDHMIPDMFAINPALEELMESLTHFCMVNDKKRDLLYLRLEVKKDPDAYIMLTGKYIEDLKGFYDEMWSIYIACVNTKGQYGFKTKHTKVHCMNGFRTARLALDIVALLIA